MLDSFLKGLGSIADAYDGVLCDVWGVVHNGVAAHAGAVDALTRFRATGKPVVLMTNAPRRGYRVAEQLDRLGVPREAYDTIVSSGEVVRAHLLSEGFSRVHHIGPERDRSLYDGDALTVTDGLDGADVVVVTDLRDDDHKPDDYNEEMRGLVGQPVPVICANPDVVVERGGEIVYCGGALVKIYEEAGGEPVQLGKPHAPIYDAARAAVAERAADATRLLAIGDGLPTDITGANRNGVDVLFVTEGIHAEDLGEPGAPDLDKVRARLSREGLTAQHVIAKLAW